MHVHDWRRARIDVTTYASPYREYITGYFECVGCDVTVANLKEATYEALVDAALSDEQPRMYFTDHREAVDSLR